MRRVFLLVVILGMCLLVTIGGMMTFLSSNGVLKHDAQYVSENVQRNIHIALDLKNNRIYLVSKGKVIRSYSVKYENHKTPPPIGNWKVVSKDRIGGDNKWLGINIPWGRYGIHGDKEPFIIGGSGSHECVKLSDNDMEELYGMVFQGTPIKIYGNNNGLIGEEVRVLKPGDRGADVFEVQKNLKARGYFNGYLNGIYNKDLQEAVHEFQRENGLRESDYLSFPFYNKLSISNYILIN